MCYKKYYMSIVDYYNKCFKKNLLFVFFILMFLNLILYFGVFMKKVISIAVSSLLLSNISFAQTATGDNSLLQSIQQKIEAKKSGLGSNVQTSSGLSGLGNKTPNKDMSEIAKSVNVMPPANETTITKTTETQTVTKENSQINSVKKPTLKATETRLSSDNNAVNINNKEFCEPVKRKVYKKPIKRVVKKTVVKKKVVNNFEMVKTQNYTPTDFSQKNNWLLSSQVNTTIKDSASHIEVSISDKQGQVIPKEQFNKDFIRVVQFANNFKNVTHEEESMNFNHTSYMFNKVESICSTIFVQYHLKSSAVPTTLVKYISQQGLLRDNIDSSCSQTLPEDLATNVNYSASNNISGLILKDNKLVSSKPVSFNIIFSKDGVIKIPEELFVYAVKKDFSDLTVLEPKNYGHAASGVLFENNLEKGQYILGYSFKEGKKENYFKNITVL